MNEYFRKNYKSEDVREGTSAAVAVKIQAPVFESQTKNKLGNTEIRSWIVNETKAAVVAWLHKNAEAAKKLEEKILANERLRTELNSVKKEAKEAAKKVALRIPKLTECRYHLDDGEKGANTMIFLTEGDSAAGSIKPSRDVNTQAVFSLRGKPENMYGKKRADIYRNAELYNMMMALGIENDVSGLRYEKIVIATDADNDGFHIRNLLLTFFLNYFEELSADIEGACYGSYFLELAGFYSDENIDGTDMLKLLYQSLRALMKPSLPNPLVRRIFELKTMVFNGEYTQLPQEQVSDSCTYAWEYVVLTPPEELYRFALKEPVLKEFERCVERARRRFLPHPCRSLEILETLTG